MLPERLESLEEISWEPWFSKVFENDLVLLYQEETAYGGTSNFNKLIKAETAAQDDNAEWVGGRADAGGGGTSGSPESSGGGSRKGSGSINLNTASAEELDGVFGIGPTTAENDQRLPRSGARRLLPLGPRYHAYSRDREETAQLIAKNARLG